MMQHRPWDSAAATSCSSPPIYGRGLSVIYHLVFNVARMRLRLAATPSSATSVRLKKLHLYHSNCRIQQLANKVNATWCHIICDFILGYCPSAWLTGEGQILCARARLRVMRISWKSSVGLYYVNELIMKTPLELTGIFTTSGLTVKTETCLSSDTATSGCLTDGSWRLVSGHCCHYFLSERNEESQKLLVEYLKLFSNSVPRFFSGDPNASLLWLHEYHAIWLRFSTRVCHVCYAAIRIRPFY